MQYDLHTHSTASDGTLSPSDLVRRASIKGVDVLALTDHDTLSGIAEARATAVELGLAFIAGVEASVTWAGQTVHIVGLNVDDRNPELLAGLDAQVEFRSWRAQEIGRRLAKKGVPDAYEGAKALSNGHLISRTHFARFLVNNGYADSVKDVFKHYLVNNKPGFVAGDWASLDKVVEWINNAGGQAVVAHPARYRMTRTKLRKLLQQFKDFGGSTVEVVSGSHSKDEYFTMARHAADFGLLSSAGSDFHDPAVPWIELGNLPALPDICRPVWDKWKN